MYRDARAEIEELKGRDPFIDIQWPKPQRAKPDPFTAEERDKIVEHWAKTDFFYFPWVFTLFQTGMRPSEASALTWADVDFGAADDINQQVEIHGERVGAQNIRQRASNSVRGGCG